ncbi:hypothetical protein ACFWWA_38555 [Streptomyces goshikiensis]|uniref:hypothetical protein n=1 Tax=Streptomyces goshikiensis TaxID=1942 RepID=UPI00364EBA55
MSWARARPAPSIGELAAPAAGYGGHPGVAALRDVGRAALVYTALADPVPATPSTPPDLAINLD